jgi:hypothetical protein
LAEPHDITIEQGATFSLVVEWQDPDLEPINLTGYTAAMQIRKTYGAPITLSLTSSSGIAIDALAGKLTITISSTATAALAAPMQGVYDLEVTSGGGQVTRLIEGKVFVTPEVTR